LSWDKSKAASPSFRQKDFVDLSPWKNVYVGEATRFVNYVTFNDFSLKIFMLEMLFSPRYLAWVENLISFLRVAGLLRVEI
jgi:hypothetical protein